jgi:hypothetical protein
MEWQSSVTARFVKLEGAFYMFFRLKAKRDDNPGFTAALSFKPTGRPEVLEGGESPPLFEDQWSSGISLATVKLEPVS